MRELPGRKGNFVRCLQPRESKSWRSMRWQQERDREGLGTQTGRTRTPAQGLDQHLQPGSSLRKMESSTHRPMATPTEHGSRGKPGGAKCPARAPNPRQRPRQYPQREHHGDWPQPSKTPSEKAVPWASGNGEGGDTPVTQVTWDPVTKMHPTRTQKSYPPTRERSRKRIDRKSQDGKKGNGKKPHKLVEMKQSTP